MLSFFDSKLSSKDGFPLYTKVEIFRPGVFNVLLCNIGEFRRKSEIVGKLIFLGISFPRLTLALTALNADKFGAK